MATRQTGKDLGRTPWHEIARMCPMWVSLAHVTEEDYVPSTDESGAPCKRARYNYVEGELVAEETQFHWEFQHLGFKGGVLRVHALNCDTVPGSSGVSIYQIERLMIAESPRWGCSVCLSAILDLEQRFCDNCGADLNMEDGRIDIAPRWKLNPERTVCPHCQSTVPADRYCDQCGADLKFGDEKRAPRISLAVTLSRVPGDGWGISGALEITPELVQYTQAYRSLKDRFGDHQGVYITWQVSTSTGAGTVYRPVIFAVDPTEMRRLIDESGFGGNCRILPYAQMPEALVQRLQGEFLTQDLPVPEALSNTRAGFDVMAQLAKLVDQSGAQVVAVVVGAHATQKSLLDLGLIELSDINI